MLNKLTQLKNHTGFIRYFENISWMICEQFLRIISDLFARIWVPRYFGLETFGVFTHVLAAIAVLIVIV